MPSSVILAALVVAWLVVLLPMVAKHRQQVRRVGGPAMTTRVLHRGDRAVPVLRRAPAAGHRSDPYWQEDPVADDTRDSEAELDDGYDTDEHDTDRHDTDRHEPEHDEVPRRRRGRGGFDPEADAVTRHARYAVRQRVVLTLIAAVVVTAVVAVTATSAAWWLNVVVDLALVGYLVYLRTQVRIEQEVRERRLNRVGRARLGVASAQAERADELPPRLRRPGAVVVEIDDEDPSFYELDEYGPPAEVELPRASGQ
ncbi:hypothetical protein GCM10027047_36500 [Rhodococcus aerolatus]